ncbi:MAG: hypothetical protein F6K04_12030 [Leptolyngbya sp. SIO4C5]|nr:hypothetical protein [Leptolyngbya sp. SIO4C5]
MDEVISLKQKVLALRRIGITTPEICNRLRLESETVLAWLIESYGGAATTDLALTPMPSSARREKHSVDLSGILSRLSEPAFRYGYQGSLWTPSRLITQFNLPRGTLYRLIHKADLSFAARLRQQFSYKAQYQTWVDTVLPQIQVITKRCRALLYLLDELRPHNFPNAQRIEAAVPECFESDMGNPVLICGLSSTGRIAGQVHWCKKQVASHQIISVLQGLLSLHPQRDLVILASSKRIHRTQAIQSFVRGQKQVRLILL